MRDIVIGICLLMVLATYAATMIDTFSQEPPKAPEVQVEPQKANKPSGAIYTPGHSCMIIADGTAAEIVAYARECAAAHDRWRASQGLSTSQGWSY